MYNFDINKAFMCGKPVKVSGLNHTAKGDPVYSFTLECEENNKTLQVNVSVWGDMATGTYEKACSANRILVEGRIDKTKDGYGIRAYRLHFA